MIYQPRNVTPSSTSLDMSIDNNFYMEIQTNNYVSKYQLFINDMNNNNVYSGDVEVLDNKLYNGDILTIPAKQSELMLDNGFDYKWFVRLYQDDYDMLITYGVVQNAGTAQEIFIQQNINIKVGMKINFNGQIKTITAYSLDTGLVTLDSSLSSVPKIGDSYKIYSNFIETIPEYILYARKTPVVTIEDIPNPLTLKYHKFLGNYEQENKEAIAYHNFLLYIDNNGSPQLIKDSGKIYSAKLEFDYDSFNTGNKYYIKLLVENNLGVITESELYSFNVNYAIIEYLQQPSAIFDSNSNSIDISWVAPIENEAQIKTTNSNVPNPVFNILYNNPYNGVDSLYNKGYVTYWESEQGLCELPDNLNITFQINPDSDFFFNGSIYNDLQKVFYGETQDLNNKGGFVVFINGKFLGIMRPRFSGEQISILKVVAPPEGENNTRQQFFVDKSITLPSDKYIIFENGYISEIDSFDNGTKKVSLKIPVNFDIGVGNTLIQTDFRETQLYSNTSNSFLLNANKIPQLNLDYIWDDSQTWNDNFYWVEGGTPIERVCNNWWKVQITNDFIKVEQI